MVALKIRKIGNSLGVTFPKEVTAKLHAKEGDTIFFTESPEGFQVTPFNPDFERQMKIAEKGMRKYRDTLRELAK